MEKAEISLHEIKTYMALKQAKGWLTTHEIAAQTGVHPRTARLHALRFLEMGIVDRVEVFPAHRFRIAAAAKDVAYVNRLEHACEVFGVAA